MYKQNPLAQTIRQAQFRKKSGQRIFDWTRNGGVWFTDVFADVPRWMDPKMSYYSIKWLIWLAAYVTVRLAIDEYYR